MYKNGFGIKYPTMIDMPWNQTKPKEYLSANKLDLTYLAIRLLTNYLYNHLTECKQISLDSFKNKTTYKQLTYQSCMTI